MKKEDTPSMGSEGPRALGLERTLVWNYGFRAMGHQGENTRALNPIGTHVGTKLKATYSPVLSGKEISAAHLTAPM